MYKIFDVHTHTYPEAISEKAVCALNAFYDFVSEGDGTYRGLTKGAKEAGVEGFLLFSVATNAHQVKKVNDGIAAQVKASERRASRPSALRECIRTIPIWREKWSVALRWAFVV